MGIRVCCDCCEDIEEIIIQEKAIEGRVEHGIKRIQSSTLRIGKKSPKPL